MNTLKEDCIVNGSDQFTDVLEHVLCGSYQVSYENADILIKDQHPFILCLLEDILTTAVPGYTKVIHSTALLYAYSVDGFTRIVAFRSCLKSSVIFTISYSLIDTSKFVCAIEQMISSSFEMHIKVKNRKKASLMDSITNKF